MNKKFIIISLVTLLLTIMFATAIGSVYIDLPVVLSVLGHKVFKLPLPDFVSSTDLSIIWILRFPRVILALLVGASLAVSGSCIQSVLKNPLASPYTLGVSSGASLGAALVIIFSLSIPFLGNFTLTILGLISGLLTVIVVMLFASRVDKNLSNTTVILAGMVVSLFINSIVTLVTAMAQDDIKRIVFWTMGSLSSKGWSYIWTLLPFFIIGVVGIIVHTKELDALSFGEENALSLGVDVKKVKKRLIFFSTVLAGSAVAVSGVIGFIGLVAPHIVRRIFGPRHSVVIPLSIVFGGIFLITTDLIARTIVAPGELPVGAITAFIGAPFFAAIYFSRKK